MAKKTTVQAEPLDKQLWKTADKLRKNIDAAEYKHIALGLIFLKYISDSFEEQYEKLKAGEGEYAGADPEDKDEYKAENVFFVPPSARWNFLKSHAKQPTIGKTVDEAMDAIERENPSLKGVLPKVYARQNLDPASLGGLIDLVSNIVLGDSKSRSADFLGHVFEYFLGQFALAEGKKGGQFYTPKSIVELLVEMLEPYNGRVYDPCCGSGGMFVQSEKFIEDHQGRLNDISIYGQESNQTTWRLAKMNLAIRGIDSSQVKWNNEGSFLNDAHKDLKADYIIANPPFNVSDWSGDLLRNDGRWQFGTPPVGNANFAWVQHFLYHLSPNGGRAGFVLADSSLTSLINGENKIRERLVNAGFLDCIVTLPSHLFSNTQITACLWFLTKNKHKGDFPGRSKETLFIDASDLGVMVKRKQRKLTKGNIEKVSKTYHTWKRNDNNYADIPGFCKSVGREDIVKNEYNLSPRRYIEREDLKDQSKVDYDNSSGIDTLSTSVAEINNCIKAGLNARRNGELIPISNFQKATKIIEEITELTNSIYKNLIQQYFLDFKIGSEKNGFKDSILGFIPETWEVKTFEELFKERIIRVKDFGYCPTVFSITNVGILPREGKFSKELSKSTENYKVAFEGDMIFGLSREIPNLDVMTHSAGAFSGAYTVYAPNDKRIGIIVGTIMRLKLMEQTDLLKGGAREGRGLDKARLLQKQFAIPPFKVLDKLWGGELAQDNIAHSTQGVPSK